MADIIRHTVDLLVVGMLFVAGCLAVYALIKALRNK